MAKAKGAVTKNKAQVIAGLMPRFEQDCKHLFPGAEFVRSPSGEQYADQSIQTTFSAWMLAKATACSGGVVHEELLSLLSRMRTGLGEDSAWVVQLEQILCFGAVQNSTKK